MSVLLFRTPGLLPWLILLAWTSFSAASLAQSTAETSLLNALRQRTAQQQVILTNFSAESVVRGKIEGNLLELAPSRVKSLSVIQFKQINLSGNHVDLKGTKRILLRKAPGQLAPLDETEAVKVEITLAPDLSESAVPGLVDALFFSDVLSAMHAIPAAATTLVPAYVTESAKPALEETPCDCRDQGARDCSVSRALLGRTSPRMLTRPEMRKAQDLPHGRFEADVAVQILPSGTVGDVWVLRASNFELAKLVVEKEQAATFRPETCHGTPVEAYVEDDSTATRH